MSKRECAEGSQIVERMGQGAVGSRTSKCREESVCDISMGVWRGPDCGKWAKKALGPRISKFHKEKMCYFNKDLEGPRVMENGQGASCPRVSKCYKENV